VLRVGIVGCGFIGRVHSWALWALRRQGLVDAAVTVVCDPDPGRAGELARPHDATVSDVLHDVDVVYVCTPTAGHRAPVEDAARRSLAVFCEKPLAPNLAEAAAVAETLERVPHQVGLVLRYSPVLRRLRDELASGRFGAVIALHLRDDQYLPNQGQYASTWRTEVSLAGGGTLIEHSIHDLDVFRWLLGEPHTVTCRTSSFHAHPGIEDVAMAGFSYPDGRLASLLSVWHQVMSRPSTRRVEVFCEQAVLWTDDDNTGPLHVQTSQGIEALECAPPGWVDELPVPADVRRSLGLYAAADKAFLDAVAAGSTPSPGAGDALAAHRLVEAAYASAAASGEVVRV
jgi:myo-inositol 2-dehydrogenase/D-chiro-inositol 1-dehydrogenase